MALEKHIGDSDKQDHSFGNRQWKPERGKVIVNAIIGGIWPEFSSEQFVYGGGARRGRKGWSGRFFRDDVQIGGGASSNRTVRGVAMKWRERREPGNDEVKSTGDATPHRRLGGDPLAAGASAARTRNMWALNVRIAGRKGKDRVRMPALRQNGRWDAPPSARSKSAAKIGASVHTVKNAISVGNTEKECDSSARRTERKIFVQAFGMQFQV